MRRRPPRSTLSPYTTRSRSGQAAHRPDQRRLRRVGPPLRRRAQRLAIDRGVAEQGGVEPAEQGVAEAVDDVERDRKSTRLNSSHANISYAVFCLTKKKRRRS